MTAAEVTPLLIHGGAGTALDIAITTPTSGAGMGAYGTTFDFIDHDPSADIVLAKRTVKERTAAGAAVVTTHYSSWTYDDTDVFAAGLTEGATMAQWEAALLADSGTITTDLSITNRTGATSTGISALRLG